MQVGPYYSSIIDADLFTYLSARNKVFAENQNVIFKVEIPTPKDKQSVLLVRQSVYGLIFIWETVLVTVYFGLYFIACLKSFIRFSLKRIGPR